MDEKVEHLSRTDPGCAVVRIVEVKLSDPAEIIHFRLLTKVFKVDKSDKVLVPCFGGDCAI